MTFDIKNYVPPRERKPAASPFYNHPYGGVGRDITVTREGFARFFEDSVECVDFMGLINPNTKSYEVLGDTTECLGYILKDGERTEYSITIINRTYGALMDHAVRTILPNHPY
jgi:hypothetical protein